MQGGRADTATAAGCLDLAGSGAFVGGAVGGSGRGGWCRDGHCRARGAGGGSALQGLRPAGARLCGGLGLALLRRRRQGAAGPLPGGNGSKFIRNWTAGCSPCCHQGHPFWGEPIFDPQVTGCELGFAALREGQVVTWGERVLAGGVSAAPERLRDVVHLAATDRAFAGIRRDGTVVSWGSVAHGGDTGELQEQLVDVCELQASAAAFAAIRRDGSVVTWGNPSFGASAASQKLQHVQKIGASDAAFAAICCHGVVTWGCPLHGGDSSLVAEDLTEVVDVQGTAYAFAALRADGQVVPWPRFAAGFLHFAVFDFLSLWIHDPKFLFLFFFLQTRGD